MAPLSTELRNKLERTIVEAREVAEAGAYAALEGMAVHHYEPYKHQSVPERKLRNHLRARARQLGDTQNARGQLQIDHLAHECAYEHWHRMIFARFLAENNLLIEPDHGIAISLEECEELAQAAGTDLWTYASRCAQQMLPQIFRPDDPLLRVTLAREHQVELERLLAGLDPETFRGDDALGWVYQFWQSKKKKEVNDSGQKITGDTLPAVTQLFTEHYMVLFLLHNTVGAWHAGKVLAANPQLAQSAASEEELRRAVALTTLDGYQFDYLRFVKDDENSPWRPAAGTFDGWPKTAAELKVLDPCCGSGHFLIAVFELLIRLRMQEENLSIEDAVDTVLKDNVFGLEIDQRCTQIAAFNLAQAAWKLTGHRPLPGVHVACSGIGPQSTEEQWLKLLEELRKPIPQLAYEPIKEGLLNLHSLFSKASTLGSLIDPSQLPKDLIAADYETLQPYLTEILSSENMDDEIHERAVAAAGMVKAIELLAGEYTLVITNVPYLGRGKQDDILKAYIEKHYSKAKADLATVFISRCLNSCHKNGVVGLVTPQIWLFLDGYKFLREDLLDHHTWLAAARLGSGAFETISGEVVNVALFIIQNRLPDRSSKLAALDVSSFNGADNKRDGARFCPIQLVRQNAQRLNPDARITLTDHVGTSLLSDFATSNTGLQTGDNDRFSFKFWELPRRFRKWEFFQRTADITEAFTGCTQLLRWEGGAGDMVSLPGSTIRGLSCRGKEGILVHRMGSLPATLFTGQIFDQNGAVILPAKKDHLAPIWCFTESDKYNQAIRVLDKKLGVTPATLVKSHFDLSYWQKVAAEKYPNGLPKPESDDPTQWLFHGRPEASTEPLQVAVARLLGYRWPAEMDTEMQLSARARELVKQCDELLKFADEDGIVCIPAVRGEEPAAERLLTLLGACGIRTDVDLDDWLRNSFFEAHCKLFHHRPFIWHIWDGRRRDGFHALVNYHKLAEGNGRGKKLLESLTYSYLGEWISRQQDGVRRGEGGAEDRLAAATELQEQLIAILEGQPPYDLFVRWKPLYEQPIGWEPDINDGVRVNIRPFMTAGLSNGRTGAGILRWKPNIKWTKDRGKEPKRPKNEYPWFWGWDEKTVDFMGNGKEPDGNRWNDCHYTHEAKQKAREEAKE